MMNTEDISGHPRSFCASYAKDIILKIIEVGHDGKINLSEEYDAWADHIYNWVMQDNLKPMSDAQLTKIDSLLRIVKPEPETLRRINARKFQYNVQEASELIDQLLKSMLPPDYQDYMNTQASRAEATRNRVERDQD